VVIPGLVLYSFPATPHSRCSTLISNLPKDLVIPGLVLYPFPAIELSRCSTLMLSPLKERVGHQAEGREELYS